MNWQKTILDKMGSLENKYQIKASGADRNIGKMYDRWDKLREFIISQAVQTDPLCGECKTIGRTGEHSWYCRKCGLHLD